MSDELLLWWAPPPPLPCRLSLSLMSHCACCNLSGSRCSTCLASTKLRIGAMVLRACAGCCCTPLVIGAISATLAIVALLPMAWIPFWVSPLHFVAALVVFVMLASYYNPF